MLSHARVMIIGVSSDIKYPIHIWLIILEGPLIRFKIQMISMNLVST